MTHSSSELRAAIRLLNRRMASSATASHIYPVNISRMNQYFIDSPRVKWLAEVKAFAKHVRGRDEKAIYLDVCGNAVADPHHFDHNYQVSLSNSVWSKKDDVTFYRRDIFDRQALRDCIEDLRARKVSLLLTTFRPIVGLGRYTPIQEDGEAYKDVVHQRLFDQLQQVVASTRIGGYLYLERPFQTDDSIGDFILRAKPNKMTGHCRMLIWAKRLKCSVRMHIDPFGQKWLLRKDYKELGPIP